MATTSGILARSVFGLALLVSAGLGYQSLRTAEAVAALRAENAKLLGEVAELRQSLAGITEALAGLSDEVTALAATPPAPAAQPAANASLFQGAPDSGTEPLIPGLDDVSTPDPDTLPPATPTE